MRWNLLEPIRQRLADERGTLRKQAARRIALCYPSPYQVGMSSLGFQTIYREIHQHPSATAERAFLPDDVAAWRESRAPLCTYESQQPVASFDCLAFSVSYELELTGLFEMLDLAGIPLLREERTDRHPLIVCGGPLTFSNPVLFAPFADHGRLDQRLEPDYAAAERTIAAIADAGIDVDILAERLQRQGAGAFGADWAALLAAIQEKAGKPGL